MKKQVNIWLMIGAPGSGKSTAAKTIFVASDSIYISRDAIRFAKLQPEEQYFAHEDEVFDEFISDIQDAINNEEYCIIADASHLTQKARLMVLSRLVLPTKDYVEYRINAVVIETPLDICIHRNAQRTGRAYVPPTAITRMYKSYEDPVNDKFKFNYIIYYDQNFNCTRVEYRKE